ncbi:hypothetical protein BV898_16589 [Hypsibius exemplaris]|uniref:Chitin-binding type-2 domain-containing protein n=1 Tax=Hypsibius exemplaris TaxID=2072580 RepID=A0A9X6RL96_HYPEX|nr:hypothetical protein BV898_16589 [Hypsibius exemplaris]
MTDYRRHVDEELYTKLKITPLFKRWKLVKATLLFKLRNPAIGKLRKYISVYTHTTGLNTGGHALTIIRWGTYFGQGGFIHFRRGTNHLGIESNMAAGMATSVTGRPPGYDRCDNLFCSTRSDGAYFITRCSKNYCNCTAGVCAWIGCPYGWSYEPLTRHCVGNDWGMLLCPAKNMTVLTPAPAEWAPPPADVGAMGKEANCDGRGTKAFYYPPPPGGV